MKKFMRTVVALGLISFPMASSWATNSAGVQYIRQINAGSCFAWTAVRDSSGMTAYGCSSYPMNYTALDGNDTLRVINHLENRIAELEAKVHELSKK